MMKSLEVKILAPIVANYDGELDSEEKRYHGVGKIQYDNSATYQGTFQNGLFQGKGVFSWPDKVQYEGEFSEGTISGNGKYSWPDESKYSGELFDGKRHGNGVFDGSSQQHYEGSWENGLRHGKGIMHYNQTKTISYNGHWQNDNRHGFGHMTYESGNVYEGEWLDDLKSGRGVMLWSDKSEIYLGEWENDLPNGRGEHIWFDTPSKSFQRQICNIYRGEWKDGMRNGYGCFFYANGSQYAGYWKDNLKHGLGTFIQPNGKLIFGEFDHDRYVNTTLDLPTPPPPSSHSQTQLLQQINKMTPIDEMSHSQYSSSHKSLTSTTGGPGGATSSMKEQFPPLRESDSVNPQYHLNINDVLSSYPVLLNKTSHANQTKDIERLLLRYNTTIKGILKRYLFQANEFRMIQNTGKSSRRDQHATLRPPTAWDSLELLFFNKRAIHDKFHTLQMQQVWQIARDCDLIGPLLTAHDVCECVKSMHAEQSNVSLNLHRQYLQQQILSLQPPSSPSPPLPSSSSAAPPDSHKQGQGGNRKRSGATKDSNESLISSRSGKGNVSRTHRDKEEGSQTSRSSKNRLNDGLGEIKEHEINPSTTVVGVAAGVGGSSGVENHEINEMEEISPDPKILELQLEIQNLPSTHQSLPPLLDTSFDRDVYHDPLFPIREREFLELLVRIIAEVTCRRPGGGLSSGGLFDSVYRTLAEILEPLASESRPIPVFTLALYSESVQLILRKRASAMRSLWDQVLEIANQGQETFTLPQVKHVVKLMRALRGTAISEEGSSVLEILEVINKKGPNDDVSSLDLHVIYDDFVELFCRLVVSNLWIFAADDESATLDHRVSVPETEGLRRANSRVTTVSIVEQALGKRLAEWLKLI